MTEKIQEYSYEKLPKTMDLIRRFLIHGHKDGGSFTEPTIEQYKLDFHYFFRWFKKEFDEITEKDAEDYYEFLKNLKLSELTAGRRISTIKGLLRYAIVRKILNKEKNPIIVKTDRREEHNKFLEVTKEILSNEEVTNLLSSMRNPRDNCLFALMYGLGLRIGEVTKIMVSDISIDRGEILIHGKGKKNRINRLKPCLINRIKLYLLVRRGGNTDVFFTGKDGRPIYRKTINKLLSEKCKELGINKPITAHSLRHTAITHMLEDGVPMPEVAGIVGHSDIKMTWRYTQIARMEQSYLNKFRDF